MARDHKTVTDAHGVDRRASGYYSTPPAVAAYIAKRVLALRPTAKTALDPCVGAQEMSGPLVARGLQVTGFDVQRRSDVYGCTFKQLDFIEYYKSHLTQPSKGDHMDSLKTGSSDRGSSDRGGFDIYVLNPPYNCHEVDYIRNNRGPLKALFPDTGALNMYAMFLDAVIEMAREGDVIGVITSDSFLTAKTHAALRHKLMSRCVLHDLLLCPTDLFWDQKADVRTCVMILQKGAAPPQHSVRTLQRPQNTGAFYDALAREAYDQTNLCDLSLGRDRDHGEIIVGVPRDITALFDAPRLGERFACVTGISTGDDKRFLRKTPEQGFSVPFYKNPARHKFYCAPQAYLADDFMDHAEREKTFMVRNKRYLGQAGITCSSMGVRFSACALPPDSAFGVNPNVFAGDDMWWVMSYLNSALCLYLLRGVLIRGNMVNAGYVARLPLVTFNAQQQARLDELAQTQVAQQGCDVDAALAEIDDIVFSASGLSAPTIAKVRAFNQSVYRAT